MTTTKIVPLVAAALVASLALSCKEVNRQESPVQLIVTTDQTIQRVDLAGGTGCNQSLGTVNIKPIVLQGTVPNANLPPNTTLDDVKINSYTVQYVRTDGGTLVPAPFTRSISMLISQGSTSSTPFVAFAADAFTQAPFAALLPTNGGRDPQTGRSTVQMDLILTVFGETLAGERVSGQTRVPLDFCYQCGGCA